MFFIRFCGFQTPHQTRPFENVVRYFEECVIRIKSLVVYTYCLYIYEAQKSLNIKTIWQEQQQKG